MANVCVMFKSQGRSLERERENYATQTHTHTYEAVVHTRLHTMYMYTHTNFFKAGTGGSRKLPFVLDKTISLSLHDLSLLRIVWARRQIY